MTKNINKIESLNNTFGSQHLNILQFLVAHKFFVFVLISKHVEIWFVV